MSFFKITNLTSSVEELFLASILFGSFYNEQMIDLWELSQSEVSTDEDQDK